MISADVHPHTYTHTHACTHTHTPAHNVACSVVGLGMVNVVGGAGVKLPQIYNIFTAGSAHGVSLATQYMEMYMYGIPVAYNIILGE